ncbi:MAG TPA: hypothetical protein VGH31_01530, partial [Acidimicrobiales bacterium]
MGTSANQDAPGIDQNHLYPPRAKHAMDGVVGDSILESADVSRAQERRRQGRHRRAVALFALIFGWVAIRLVAGQSFLP